MIAVIFHFSGISVIQFSPNKNLKTQHTSIKKHTTARCGKEPHQHSEKENPHQAEVGLIDYGVGVGEIRKKQDKQKNPNKKTTKEMVGKEEKSGGETLNRTSCI